VRGDYVAVGGPMGLLFGFAWTGLALMAAVLTRETWIGGNKWDA